MDKSKQHWQKVQERRRKEAERRNADFEASMRRTISMMRDLANAFISCKAAHMQEEGERDNG